LAPRTARLAGGHVQRRRGGETGGQGDRGTGGQGESAIRNPQSAINGLEHEESGSTGRDFVYISPIIRDDSGAARKRSVQPIAGARPALPNGGRDDPRRDARRERAAQPQAGRPERLPPATRRRLEIALQRREMDSEQGRRPF